MSRLHPRILASNEARIDAEYKRLHHVHWRDAPWMIGGTIVCIAFPFVLSALKVALMAFYLVFSAYLLRQVLRNRRDAPHRYHWWDVVVLGYIFVSTSALLFMGAASALKYFGWIV